MADESQQKTQKTAGMHCSREIPPLNGALVYFHSSRRSLGRSPYLNSHPYGDVKSFWKRGLHRSTVNSHGSSSPFAQLAGWHLKSQPLQPSQAVKCVLYLFVTLAPVGWLGVRRGIPRPNGGTHGFRSTSQNHQPLGFVNRPTN